MGAFSPVRSTGSDLVGLLTVYSLRSFCEAGGLISCGPDLKKMYTGAASYVDQI
jgi:hypothetical protein